MVVTIRNDAPKMALSVAKLSTRNCVWPSRRRVRGEILDAACQGIEPLTAKRTSESRVAEEPLMEEVCDRKNLKIAWKRVRWNSGIRGTSDKLLNVLL